MANEMQLRHPWLIAVWPGMGHVALNAGVYLLSKLDMSLIAEFESGDLFDIEQVEVKEGLIQPAKQPRNRLYLWTDPNARHDLVIFLGEAQPPIGKYPFCRNLIRHTKTLGVERVFTFAAMATGMHPNDRSRVFGASTTEEGLAELRQHELELLQEGHIGGLNGVLLGAAAEAGVPGACLLGEMPQVFAQLPYPKASLAILEVFRALTDIELDMAPLTEQAEAMDRHLSELYSRVEQTYRERSEETTDELDEEPLEEAEAEPGPAEQIRNESRQRVEQLFAEAARDRSRAFTLKQELDRLGLFKEYEDRFLDLFKKPDGS